MKTRKYQTLTEFVVSPFGNRDVQKYDEYESKYKEFILSNRIRVYGMCIVEGSYYFHIKVPSESKTSKDGKYEYDVVIRFFTENTDISKEGHLRNYNIQFFSNSPSFIYKYAYLYKKEGYLINALYNKLDPSYFNTPPEKSNPDMKLSYDKSIYFACRYLSDKQFRYLDKKGHILNKKIDSKKFFSNISDFKSIKMDQAILSEEKKLSDILKNKSPRSAIVKARAKLTTTKADKEIGKSLTDRSTVYAKRVKAKSKITGNSKKRASKSTTKK